MTTRFFLRFDGEPVGKRAPTILRNGGAFTPAKSSAYEKALKALAALEWHGAPLDGQLGVHIDAKLPIPKSWSKQRTAEALSGRIAPSVKPDIDNIAKLCLDALKTIVFVDDKQVTYLSIGKTYSAEPCVEITVSDD